MALKFKFFKRKKTGIAIRKTSSGRRPILGGFSIRTFLLGILLWALVVYLFYGAGITSHLDIAEGQRVPATVVASVDFECESLNDTAFNRNKARKEARVVFNLNTAPEKHAAEIVDKLFARLDQYHSANTNQMQAITRSIGDMLLGLPVPAEEFISMFPSNSLKEARSVFASNIDDVMSAGVLSDDYRHTLFQNTITKQLEIRESGQPSRSLTLGETYSPDSAVEAISTRLAPFTTEGNGHDKLIRLLTPLVENNLEYDEAATTELGNEIASAIPPSIQQYLTGTTLVRAGENATAQTILLLQKHEEKRQEEQEVTELLMQIIGNSLFLLSGLIATALILRIVAPKIIVQPNKLLLLGILSLLTLSSARILLLLANQYQMVFPSMLTYIVPHALAILLASILIGSSSAICLGLWTSFATAILFGLSFNVFALGLLVTITATVTARNAHRRASLFRAGLWVCAIKILLVLISGILNQPVIPILLGQLLAAIVSGMLSTLLTLLFIPIFEKIFRLTTDITLLELSDMGHPLLQKMAIQAPGTYHHSLMVATLAQTAAEKIGANSLLTRVCAYYHDIGKLAKPEFFTENIQHQENPHDELSPHMSALVITSHVKEGLTLAKKHKLPQPVLDAIEQHHGNGLISFFYHKAKTQNEKDAASNGSASTEQINDSDFRYGGRPAVSKEMAILSLADASEAASRSIEKPTPQKITNLMNDIFAAKIRDGQMDFADLTMSEISAVRESFIFSLSNMLHGRIPYPKDNENNNSQKTADDSGEPDADKKTD